MKRLSSTTSLQNIIILEWKGGLPAKCEAEIKFHDETFYVYFDFTDVLHNQMRVQYRIEGSMANELEESFIKWMDNNEAFWDDIYFCHTFYNYRR